jgi:hypothetical protein
MNGTLRFSDACFYDLAGGLRAKFSAMTPKAMLLFASQYSLPIIRDPADLAAFKTVFFSLHCFRDFYRVAEMAHHKQPGQEWIAGGNAAATPVGIAWIMDYIWIGDCRESFGLLVAGERHLPGLLRTRDGLAPVRYIDEDLQPGHLNDSEIEMSKGCPRRCAFCIHPWRHRYQEQPKEAVVNFIRQAPGKGVGLVSNSSDDVSYYAEVAELLDNIGKTDMVVSNAVQGLTPGVVSRRKRELLLGVEGMSQRLRAVVNKPIAREVLRDKVDLCLGLGKQIRTVYQFNLPGEEARDFEELKADVALMQAKHKAGSWSIPFIPNQPSAHTPFQWLRPRYSVEMFDAIQAFRTSLFGSRLTGMALYAPAPLGPEKWFSQVIAEWVPVTPKVAQAVKRLPPRADVPTMVQALDSLGVPLPAAFLERKRDTVFPWSHVQTSGDDSDKWARYEKVQAILAGPLFRPEAA